MKTKKPFLVVLVLMLITLAGVSYYYWYNNAHFVTTEDATVSGEIYRAAPMVTGEVAEVRVKEGDLVQAGDVVARLEDTTLPPGSNLDLTVVRAPVSGLVIRVNARVGEVAAAGQPVALMVDPNDLYIEANIEEGDLHKVKVGQEVDVTVDSLPGVRFSGRVNRIGEATLSTFSILPAMNTGGSFTKVVQRVPVKITLEDVQGHDLIFGTNAVVKIHVR